MILHAFTLHTAAEKTRRASVFRWLIVYVYVEVGSRFTSVHRKGTGNFMQRSKCSQKPQIYEIQNVL